MVVIIILIGLGVWYFTSTGSKDTNANSNSNSYTINTNQNTNANTNSNANAATGNTNANTNANANTNSSSQLTTNDNTNRSAGPDYTVSMDEYSFSPAELKVNLGSMVTVKVTNTGAASHSFAISSLGVNSGLISPGGSKTVTFTAPSTAATYEIDCTVPGHKDLGMTGTLKIMQL